jgi:hypothetical protein
MKLKNFWIVTVIVLVFVLPVGAIKTNDIIYDRPILTANKFVSTDMNIKLHSNMNYTGKLNVHNANKYLIASDPKKGKLTLGKNGKFTYIPNKNFVGIDSFKYKANNGNNKTNTATVTITVYNNAPVVNNNIKVNTTSYTSYHGKLNSIDKDGDFLTYKIIIGPRDGTLKLIKNGSFTYIPNDGFKGTDSFTYKSNDGINDSNIGTLTVITTNSPPLANNIDIDSQIDKSYTGKFNTTDIDNDPLKSIIISSPRNGTIKLNKDGTYTYMLNKGFIGADSFTYRSNDGFVDSNIATVKIIINSPPFANDITIITILNTPINGKLYAKDRSGGLLTYSITSEPSNGTVTLNNDGTYIYTPNQNFQGIDHFNYKVNNGCSDSNNGTTTIIIIHYPEHFKSSKVVFTNPYKSTNELGGV